jgi:hypothetical protein
VIDLAAYQHSCVRKLTCTNTLRFYSCVKISAPCISHVVTLAEPTAVCAAPCLPVPDGSDHVMAAAIAIPSMWSWAADKERANLLLR